jgi:hypothetical protein
MFGLGFATLLTLIFVPALYSVFFRIATPEDAKQREAKGKRQVSGLRPLRPPRHRRRNNLQTYNRCHPREACPRESGERGCLSTGSQGIPAPRLRIAGAGFAGMTDKVGKSPLIDTPQRGEGIPRAREAAILRSSIRKCGILRGGEADAAISRLPKTPSPRWGEGQDEGRHPHPLPEGEGMSATGVHDQTTCPKESDGLWS